MVTVRAAVPADMEAVTAIESASFSDPWTAESFASALELAHIRFFVAEESGREGEGEDQTGGSVLVGYVVALVVADEGEIADLAVLPSARRRGVGGMLLDLVASESARRGIRALYLEVRESNVAARALYESRGFSPVGRRRGYYRSPVEDALLLRRDLVPA